MPTWLEMCSQDMTFLPRSGHKLKLVLYNSGYSNTHNIIFSTILPSMPGWLPHFYCSCGFFWAACCARVLLDAAKSHCGAVQAIGNNELQSTVVPLSHCVWKGPLNKKSYVLYVLLLIVVYLWEILLGILYLWLLRGAELPMVTEIIWCIVSWSNPQSGICYRMRDQIVSSEVCSRINLCRNLLSYKPPIHTFKPTELKPGFAFMQSIIATFSDVSVSVLLLEKKVRQLFIDQYKFHRK